MKINKKFTPAPWQFEIATDENYKYPNQIEFNFIGPIRGSGQIDVDSLFCSLADANLIIAAPEMFKLIKRINAHLVRPDLLGDLIDDAEKLIAKAEGHENETA